MLHFENTLKKYDLIYSGPMHTSTGIIESFKPNNLNIDSFTFSELRFLTGDGSIIDPEEHCFKILSEDSNYKFLHEFDEKNVEITIDDLSDRDVKKLIDVFGILRISI